MGRHHARNYAVMPGVELVAVVDADRTQCDEVGSLYSCNSYSNIEDMFKRTHPDVVSVCVPTSKHLDVTCRLLSRGVSVLVEKPVAGSLVEAEQLRDAASRSTGKIAVGHIERFNPAVTSLKRLIRSGRLGTVIQVMTRREGPNPERIRDANIVFDIGTHDIDIMHYLLERAPVAVYASGGRFKRTDHEDYASLMLIFGGESSYPVTGYIQVNWVTRAKVRRIEVVGTEGYASVDLIKQSVTLHSLELPPVFRTYEDYLAISGAGHAEEIEVEKDEPLKLELQGFIDYCQGTGKNIVTLEEGIAAVGIATYATQEIRAHRTAAAADSPFGGTFGGAPQ